MYNKKCKYCNDSFIGTGPASTTCSKCKELNKYVRVCKGIKYNGLLGIYKCSFRRDSSGNLYFKTSSLNEAKAKLLEWDTNNYKESNTGIYNNTCRGGNIDGMYNWGQLKKQIKLNPTFVCNRCTKTYSINKLNLHHIDHNRDNDSINNFEILCTYCHREHHNIRGVNGRFGKSSETISEESTLQVNGSGSGVSNY